MRKMTDRPGGSTMPVEVGKAEEVMSVAETEGVIIGSVVEPEDRAPEPVCASVGATSKLEKSSVVPGSEAIML